VTTKRQEHTIRSCELRWMRAALRLARRGHGATSPNPMVGAVLVKGGKIIGRGWHRRAGLPHAEIEALREGVSPRKLNLNFEIPIMHA
jgi:pyrimidine deaminase RibD-like protein